jgi:hypothetical protein
MTEPQGWTALVTAVLAIGGGVMAWQKTRSRDSVDAVKDRAEEGIIERLQKRADAADIRADALFAEIKTMGVHYTDVVRANERLASDLDHVSGDYVSLKRQMRRMAEGLPPELRHAWEQALETDFSPLGGPETK